MLGVPALVFWEKVYSVQSEKNYILAADRWTSIGKMMIKHLLWGLKSPTYVYSYE